MDGMEKRIYLDYAASTPIAPEVLRAMMPFLEGSFGNPNSVHAEGKEAAKALRESRDIVADGLRAKPEEIIFTGSGTEANNIAIRGALKEAKKHISGISHIIVSSIEHSSVLTLAKVLAEEGVEVDYCRVDQDGIIDLDELTSLLRDETILVSVMYVNNEIGTIQPVGEVARIIKEYKQKKGGTSAYPLLHTDAAQAPLYLEMDTDKLGADLLTIDAQKIYGPKGVGALYIKKGIHLEPVFFGGGQEKSIRPSTQNVAGIVGLAEALKIVGEKRDEEVLRLRDLQDYFFLRIKNEIPQAVVNGSTERGRRVPNNVNVSVPGVEGDYLVVALDSTGVAASSVSACGSREGKASHVVRAISEGDDRAESAIRFTMGRETGKEDIDIAVEALKKGLDLFGTK
jgi:cysteine desulfurase